MAKIALTTRQFDTLVDIAAEAFENGAEERQARIDIVGYCRDKFGFWMTEDQVALIFGSAVQR